MDQAILWREPYKRAQERSVYLTTCSKYSNTYVMIVRVHIRVHFYRTGFLCYARRKSQLGDSMDCPLEK